ncbi:hypothetical protein BHE74_00040607 [Ensete ventricosum]|nr:hypothetical protein GW17_00054136 [Ensete ventricosum]RWW52934.1 hypothetical protein BHE74_00040607 [Ensete ventricosum]RZS04282.1 hypothetical protein BHM03_00034598 [Ensete ventricosum]
MKCHIAASGTSLPCEGEARPRRHTQNHTSSVVKRIRASGHLPFVFSYQLTRVKMVLMAVKRSRRDRERSQVEEGGTPSTLRHQCQMQRSWSRHDHHRYHQQQHRPSSSPGKRDHDMVGFTRSTACMNSS